MTASVIAQTAGLIIQSEGFVPGLYLDSDGIATMGYGFALVVKNASGQFSPLSQVQVANALSAVGVNLNDQQLNQLSGYLLANAPVKNKNYTPDQGNLNDKIPTYGLAAILILENRHRKAFAKRTNHDSSYVWNGWNHT